VVPGALFMWGHSISNKSWLLLRYNTGMFVSMLLADRLLLSLTSILFSNFGGGEV